MPLNSLFTLLLDDYPNTPAVVYIRGIPKDLQHRILFRMKDMSLSLTDYLNTVAKFLADENFSPSTDTEGQSVATCTKKKVSVFLYYLDEINKELPYPW